MLPMLFAMRRMGWNVGLSNVIASIGPVFIKMGQMLSTRADLFSSNVIQELTKLQDNTPSFAHKKAHSMIMSAFPDAFDEISKYAISSASVAQVHIATLQSGQIVAVKVLRPHIRKDFKRDIRLIKKLWCIVAFCSKKLRKLNFKIVIERFEQGLLIELNLAMEAANAEMIRDKIKYEPEAYIPKIHWDLSNENILTMEYIDGTKITEASGDKQILAENLITIFLKQVYRDGVFHADLHPANILVRADKICFVDFGIVGRLSAESRHYLTEIFSGFLEGDYEKVADVHFEAGYLNKDYNRFVLACRVVGEAIVNRKSRDVAFGALLRQLFSIMNEFDMTVQEELLLFQKTIVMLEGVVTQLDPDVNIWEIARPFITKWSIENMHPIEKIWRVVLYEAQMPVFLRKILNRLS